jgi:peptidoglycan/xylan/chitin deacetylase (PgdA/CDA1 family)
MSVSPAVFDTQMQWIADHGYTTVTMDTAADILAGKRNDIAKPVVITFDDNNLTQYTLALPILEKYHQIAVFYLVTNRLANAGVIDAERAKDLHRRGMDVESHSVTHSTLTALSLKRLDQELVESKKTLEALLGKTVSHIAYPSTAHNKTVRAHAAAAGYVTGTIMDPRPAKGTDDLFKLPRIMMTDETRLERVLP